MLDGCRRQLGRTSVTTDPHLPTPEEILATHEEIEEAYDMKYTGTKVAAPNLKLRRIVRDAADYDDVFFRAAHLLRK